jgi:GNAT superfamily N-acetyltransferase
MAGKATRLRSTYSLHVHDIAYEWRGEFASRDVERLHAAAFEREPSFEWDWLAQVERHSLGWVCARLRGELVGWVNVAWDGGVHAFLLDTIVAEAHRRSGIATQLVRTAVENSREQGCEWLHVDFEPHLRSFYWESCGFTATEAGVVAL